MYNPLFGVGWMGNPKISPMRPSPPPPARPKTLWENIHETAKTNPQLKDMVEKCEVYYRLLEENK